MQKIKLTYDESTANTLEVDFNGTKLTENPEPFEMGRTQDGFEVSSFRCGDKGIMRVLVSELFHKCNPVFYVHISDCKMTIRFTRMAFCDDIKDFIYKTLHMGMGHIVTVN